MTAIILQLKGNEVSALFSQITDVESLSQTWKLCTKVASHLDQGERLENLSWRLFYLHSVIATGGLEGGKTIFRMLSKKTGQKIGRERNLRVNQLKSPPIRRSQASGNKLSSLSSTNHHPEVCSYSKSVSNVNQNLQVDCDINAVPFADTSETNFKSNAVNFESFLASFSPVALFSAINYFSENSQPPCNDSIETVSPFSTTVLNTVNCPSESREISALEPPVGLYGTDGFSHLLLENQSTQQEYTGAGLFAASDCAIFDEWNFISRPNISPITTLDYEEDVNLQRGLEEDTQRSLKSYKCSQDYVDRLLVEDVPSELWDLSNSEKHLDNPPSLPQSHKNDMIPFKKVGKKRKRRNPMATQPPTFIGAAGKPGGLTQDDFSGQAICTNCQGTQTPLWRRGERDELLCNACGVFYKVHKKNRPSTLRKHRNHSGPSGYHRHEERKKPSVECFNCGAKATPMWRKAPDGNLMCNACALYFKCHKRPRPVSGKYPTVAEAERFDGYDFAGSMQGVHEISSYEYNRFLGKPCVPGLYSMEVKASRSALVNKLGAGDPNPYAFGEVTACNFLYP